MQFDNFKNHEAESKTFRFRAVLAFLFVLVLLAGVFSRYYYLQVVQHDHFAAMSDDNRISLQPIAPTRGLLYDRNGVLLADNQPSYTVTLLKEEVKDMDATIAEIASLITVTDGQIERFKKRLRQRRRPFESLPLRSRLTEDEIAILSVNYHRLPGVRVEAGLIRQYPYGETLVHALGYVGRINEKELKSVDEKNYAATHYFGRLGIEKYYEPVLHGTAGYQRVETNARGRVMRVIDRVDPVPGKNLVLTLDLKLQQVAESLLEGRRASVVAIDPKDGGILALVSTPGYDPNAFVTGISSKAYGALRDSDDLPLFNRALRGQYPPGSTIKPMIALAAIDSETVSPSFKVRDPGWYSLTEGGRKYRDWKRTGHGTVDLDLALAQSCDVWFYTVGNKMGVDPMAEYLGHFGFGQITSLDLPEARRGIRPSKEWKRSARNLPWYPGDSLNLSIGQGFMLATPLQLATATAVLANRGKWVQPHMLKGEYTSSDEDDFIAEYHYDHGKASPKDIQLNHPEYWDNIIDGMVSVVHGPRGTARRSAIDAQYRFAGKTGTAQVVGIKQDEEYDAEKLLEIHRDHALFIAFAPVEDPQIAIAVIVENGGGGSSTAAPIARKVMDAYLLGEEIDTSIEGLQGFDHD
ncbi:MAG: penicillin-binding protein 2 [Pontibacterium sp.]